MSTSDNLFTIGIDIGGTKIDTALVDSSGQIIHNCYRLIGDSKHPDAVIPQLLESIDICQKESGRKASAIGIGIAGQIDKENGLVRRSPNLPEWNDVPLKDKLQNTLKIPVTINNDVRVITWGEWKHGAGQGIDDLVCIFAGTGVGGGIVSGGRLIEGSCNTAGEIGHMVIISGGRRCKCGGDGCLEAYVGGWAVAERAQNAVEANPEAGKTLIELAGDKSSISAITVSEALKRDDPLARRIVKDTAKYLASGLISIINVFNPRLIILGGSVIQGIPEIMERAEIIVKEKALPTPLENLRIITGALGNKAGVIGAAAQARYSII